MDLEKHKNLFNTISPVYNWFFNYQVKRYSKTLELFCSELDLNTGDFILDIGCGTGAFSKTFSQASYDVTGVDISERMLKYARKNGIQCFHGNIIEGLNLEDKSFNLVTSALVCHGIDRDKRIHLFKESARLSKGKVLFHDYSMKRNLIINIIEYLEDGDYFNFIKTGLSEMKEIFSDVKIVPVSD